MILDVCKRYPVMSSYQLVVVREAQHLSKPFHILKIILKNQFPPPFWFFVLKEKKSIKENLLENYSQN